MGKKLIKNYEFDASARTVYVGGIQLRERILLITNVTTHQTIYTFNSQASGISSYSIDPIRDRTVVVLDFDTTGMSDTDSLQIFVEDDYTHIEPSESFIDPVNKLRVSNPQNLIDTDFEYGLQPSKWETVELVNNIPSFYSSASDYIIPDIVYVRTTAGSNAVEVKTSTPHGVSVGSPIDIQGLNVRTAEGKYLVTSVPDTTTFLYQSSRPQGRSEDIQGSYTTITPGQFYAGSEVQYDSAVGVRTDAADPSTLTIQTDYVHGFDVGSSLYVTNTVARYFYNIFDTNATAPDGNTYLDERDTVPISLDLDTSLTETKEMQGKYSLKFNAAANVNTVDNTILWPDHQLHVGAALLYIAPQGDSPIGGLERFQFYYVKSIDGDNITLCQTTSGNFSGNATINLTSVGTNNYGRHQLLLVYEIRRIYRSSRNRYTYFYTAHWEQGGTRSGYDRLQSVTPYYNDRGFNGYHGLGGYPERHILVYKGSYGINSRAVSYGAMPYYSTSARSTFTLGGTGTAANDYNFMEDYRIFSGLSANNQYNYVYNDQYYIRVLNANGGTTATGTYSYYPPDGNMFYVPLEYDAEGDSFYAEDHGLSTGNTITLTKTAGSNFTWYTHTGTYYTNSVTMNSASTLTNVAVTAITEDRFSLQGTYERIRSANGSYNVSANLKNDLNDTFYIDGGHNLFEGQKVYLENTSGNWPTAVQGAIEPVWYDKSFVQTVYDTAQNWHDTTYMDAIGTHHRRLYFSGTSHYYPIRAGNYLVSSPNGNGYQYERFNHQYWTVLYKAQYYTSQYNQQGNFATGEAWDPFASTAIGGLGFYQVHTPFSTGGTVNNFLEVTQIPETTDYNTYWYAYKDWYKYRYYGYSWTNLTGAYNIGDGWVFWHAYKFHYGSGLNYAHAHRYVVLMNTNWAGYNQSGYDAGNYSREPWLDTARSYYGPAYIVKMTTPIDGNQRSGYYASSGTIDNGYNQSLSLANALKAALTKPSITTPTTVAYASPVNATRIRLTGMPGGPAYDFSSRGTGSVQIYTDEVIGGADNFYEVSQASDTIITLPTTGVLPERELEVVSASVDVVEDSISYQDHKLGNLQEVVYNTISGSIGGLSNGTTYYARVIGPDNFHLAETPQMALGNEFVDLTSASGSVKFTSKTISGVCPGVGTVDLVSGETKVYGENTIFKRYFKQGDVVRFRNTSVNPNEYFETRVVSVITDNEMTIQNASPINETGTNYYVQTRVNVRPNGSYTHRPFDGGVEINAGTSPNSSIVRQTRKYFRYQSGKGIQVSLAINFNPSRIALRVTGNSTYAYVYTELPHGLVPGNVVTIDGCSDNAYNGQYDVDYATDYMFRYAHGGGIRTTVPTGIIKYNIQSYGNAAIRAGMFDYQNGFFFEYDGEELYCCRRSSVQQLPGSVNVTNNSNVVIGNDTRFVGQLTDGDYVVIRGMSYRITRVVNNTTLHVQPSYRGTNATNVIMTKTEDVKVPRPEWSIDKADGSGPSGYVFDETKIQMAYCDYSWYGAGKIRFGFKDTYGHVRYMHEFIHNNRLEEAYMRSGNIPARYEVLNGANPTYVPGLFHWGTSIIMDGTFDDDKAYLFTASSNPLVFTNGDSETSTTNQESALHYVWAGNNRYDFYLRLSFGLNEQSKFAAGALLFTSDEELDGDAVSYTQRSGSNVFVYIFLKRARWADQPEVYPQIPTNTIVNIGSPSGGETSDSLISDVPLISIRLAPSVDNNLTGELGAREIINRMQLQLKTLGITVSHDCDVTLILNGSVDNFDREKVTNPSLSELIKHEVGDQISGGSRILSLRASGGTIDQSTGKRLEVTTEYDLSQITDLGNAILGGDGVFPNGPDLLTIALQPVDTSTIDSQSPLKVGARVTWTESQA